MNTEDKPDIEAVKAYLIELQKNICAALAAEDGKEDFIIDEWQRETGAGGGITLLNRYCRTSSYS